MCIILYKKSGVELPQEKWIDNCFKNHDDGAGIYYQKKEKRQVVKGLMKVNQVKNILKTLTKEDVLIIHFRTGTSGGNKNTMTHPFPLTSNKSKLTNLRYKLSNDVLLFHNGILTIPLIEGLSDTATLAFKLGMLSLKEDVCFEIVSLVLQNDKGLLVFPNGDIKIINEKSWSTAEGILFSNDSYKYTYVYSYGYGNKAYNWKDYAHPKYTYQKSLLMNNNNSEDHQNCKYKINLSNKCSITGGKTSYSECFYCGDYAPENNNYSITEECGMCGDYVPSEELHDFGNAKLCLECYQDRYKQMF